MKLMKSTFCTNVLHAFSKSGSRRCKRSILQNSYGKFENMIATMIKQLDDK